MGKFQIIGEIPSVIETTAELVIRDEDKGSKLWLTSDTHFYHENIIKYCNRPFKDFVDMNNRITRNWNDTVVRYTDQVFILGDFMLGGARIADDIPVLNGVKSLIRGNHDTDARINMLAERGVETEDIRYYRYKGVHFIFCHYPLFNPDFFKRYAKIKENNPEIVMVHGHTHNTTPFYIKDMNMFNVSQDVTEFRPVNIDLLYNIVHGNLELKN